MQAFSINLPLDVQSQITSFASQYGVDPLIASGVAQVSSGGKQFNPDGSLVVSQFGVGVMGVSKEVAVALGLDATNQVQNIQAGIAALAALRQAFVGNYALILSAYATSVATVRQFNGIPPLAPVSNFVYNVSTIAANAGSPRVSVQKKIQADATLDPSDASSETAAIIQPTSELLDPKVQGNDNITNQSQFEPILQVPDVPNTLSNTAWYDDQGLVTGNPRIRNSVQPIKFMIYLDRNDPTQFLKNPADGSIIELQLNTSLESFEIASRHVYNRTPSRTGMHITLWGMELDLITGSGTTGVFMNQFGLTDFMSTAGYNDDIKKLLTSGFRYTFQKFQNAQSNTAVSTGEVVVGNISQGNQGDLPQIPHLLADRIISQTASNPNEAFRVAAQDAFVEFLKLFQMNGNVWYYSQAYTQGSQNNGTNLGIIGGMEQQSPTAWSQKTGASSFSQHSRNNDVMTRGYVAMQYRNNVYLGYFKNLSWTQSADSPFQWKFNFSFQVEKTYTALYFTQPSVTQQVQPETGQQEQVTACILDQNGNCMP